MALKLSDYDPALKAGADIDVTVDLNQIVDNSGNEMLEFDSNSSAVNYLRVANAATGSDPALSAQGDDTNIGLQLTAAGTANVLVGSLGTVATIAAGVVTINAQRGIIQSGVTIAAGSSAFYSFNLANTKIVPSSMLFLSTLDTPTTGNPVFGPTTLGTGSAVIRLADGWVPVPMGGSTRIQFIVLN